MTSPPTSHIPTRERFAEGFDHGRWNWLHRNQLDIDVRDPDGHTIGLTAANREPLRFLPNPIKVLIATGSPAAAAIVAGLRELNFGGWGPLDETKQILVGELDHYSFFNTATSGDEADFNIFITPDPAFRNILDKAIELMKAENEWLKEQAAEQARADDPRRPRVPRQPRDPQAAVGDFPLDQLHKRKRAPAHCDERGVGPNDCYCVECEITPDEEYYNNFWFPTQEPHLSPLVGITMGVYGPWVRDFGHGGRPEIHPCEVIWWRNGSFDDLGAHPHARWTIVVLQDDSNRFDRASDYRGPIDRPWSKSPRRAHITLALQVPRGEHGEYYIAANRAQRVFEHPGEDARSVSREYDGQPAVTVTKRMSHPRQLKVRLTPLSPDPTNSTKLRGFLDIDVQVGEGDRGQEGFIELSIEHWVPGPTTPLPPPPPPAPGQPPPPPPRLPPSRPRPPGTEEP